jgi:MscS family membrane protein
MDKLATKRCGGPRRAVAFSLLLLMAAFLGPVFAQSEEAEKKKVEAAEALVEILATEQEPQFVDLLGRETPRSSTAGFFLAAESSNFARAAEFMDFRNLPAEARRIARDEAAEMLYLVISRTQWIDLDLLSDDPNGSPEMGVPEYRETLGEVTLGDEEVGLFLQRVPADEGGAYIWKVSNATVALIPDLYEVFGYPEWIENVRQKVPPGYSFLGVEGFKWVILVGVGVILWPLMWVLFYGISRLVSTPGSGIYPEVRKLLTGPLPFFILAIVVDGLLKELGLGATAQKITQAHTVNIIIIVWLLFRIIDLFRGIRRERFIARGRDDAAILGRPMANALKLLVLLLAVLVWLSNLGVNISALLAGLGVGGIAMALALQKPIEDLFGAVTLYSQRPIMTGDVCRYGNHFGRVEEIGLRSTRIRTQGNTVVTVPNSRLAYEDIENISARKSVWYQPMVRLRIDTTPAQVRQVVDGIRQFLIDDERVLNDVLRVQFRQFGEYSLDIKVHCYVDTIRFDEYLQIAEELNFRILEIVHEAGASLALPERGGYFAQAG